MIKRFLDSIQRFIENHIIAECPWPDVCFDCNRSDCERCEYFKD